MNIVVMLAGPSKGFEKNNAPYSKLLTEINGKTMIELVLGSFDLLKNKQANIIFMINKLDDERYYLGDVIKMLVPNSNIVRIQGETAGAALTSLLAIEHIREDDSLVLVNGDQVIDHSESGIVEKFISSDFDAATVVFDSVHPRWSYVKIDSYGHVYEAAEKRPISNKATAGIYYYKKTSDYIRCCKKMILKGDDVDGVFYVCPVFNEMILEQKTIGTFEIDASRYHSFMSPDKIRQFEKDQLNERLLNPIDI